MDEKNNKTSILYNIGNYKLEYDVIHDYGKMCGIFNNGPEAVKEYLVDIWNETRENLMKQNDVKVLDVERVVSKDDFDVTFNMSTKKEPVFFITLPNYNNWLSESLCIAFAITENKPRFFTMEHHQSGNNEEEFVLGEIEFRYLTNDFQHNNYGTLERKTVSNFATRVLEILEH